MELKPLLEVEKLADKKQVIFQTNPIHYILRAALASMFIGFGVIVAFKTGGYFYQVQSPVAYPMAAITFGAAIILIAFGGGDLFTGNTFYFTFSALRKKMTWSNVWSLLAVSYLGNTIGAILFALLIYTTGLFTDAPSEFLLAVVEKKMHAPFFELFFRGILCNWLVCLAFFIPMNLSNDAAKLFVMILFVFCFFISGYEHSIANMCTFAIALVIEHPISISFQGVLYNLIPVSIGNLIGGSILMGWMYYFVNKPYLEKNSSIE
ncbi:formate/nitrite transporter family protein [Cytobacillus spongiae]|jgi:nitrite transporter NirC|uniref:formate/nitrite transporter family protein n=1 Tax=Cytobacillus spongiae TaxID=2901381 RepID=UPI001F2A16DB|nr:formate/nitrite transporter family protein [Cytobacillus spongiae]UII57083.1 formate/nitrite transporter family protein [Cytobacillus spongiae]